MSLINKTNFLSKYLKDLAIFLKYSTREMLFLLIASALFCFEYWFYPLKLKEITFLESYDAKILEIWKFGIFISVFVIAAGFVIYVFYRYYSKIALVRHIDNKELANSIKGLMAFTNEDGKLFLKLERDKELIELKGHINNSQIPFVVVMGESGAGKTLLLRTGLSHFLKVMRDYDLKRVISFHGRVQDFVQNCLSRHFNLWDDIIFATLKLSEIYRY